MAEIPDSTPDQPVGPTGSLPPDDATRVNAQPPPASRGPAAHGAEGAAKTILQAGQLLAHTYEIEAFIARGGMGEVYRARHIDVGSKHAIKVILPELTNSSAIITMFTEEARKLRMVRDDAVVAYDGMFRDESGLRYLVMEFADGPPLSVIMRLNPLTEDEIYRLRDRIAQGLATAHAREIYHRDISPDNIILVDGRVDQAKIIDFGIAKAGAAGEKTIIGTDFAGKYSYVAPEQLGMFGGAVDGRSDMYSLALLLAAAALGRPLPMGNSPASAVEARRNVPDLSALPTGLRLELAEMLEPDPARRPSSLRELRARWAGAVDRAAKPVPTASAGRGSGRKSLALAASALGLVAVAVTGFVLYRSQTTPTSLTASSPAKPPELASTSSAPPPSNPVEQASLPSPAPPPAATAPPDLNATRALVDEAVASFDAKLHCADVKTALADDGSLNVTGFVSNDADPASLRRALGAIPGIKVINVAIPTYLAQHCDVIKLLDDRGALAGAAKPRLDLNIPGLTYRDGDLLVVRTTAAINSYIYVDFFDNTGQVVHMKPLPKQRNDIVPAGQVVTLGTDNPESKDAAYEMTAPFGPNLIVAIAARQPLFEPRTKGEESVQPYLTTLAQALARGDTLASSAFTIIQTVPR
jgi:eukaryotic-like serine/threonine-protein kinase